ncbi:MAG: tetratricopeptide repeat protein [Promethearchaeota archaeon]
MSLKFVQKGLKKLVKENWAEAEDEFVKAVELNDISAKGWYYLAICREKQNDPESALFSFKKAIAAAKMQVPEDIEVIKNSYYKMAQIQFSTKQYIATMGQLRILIQMDFKDNELKGNAWGMLGEIYDILKKPQYALFCFKQSLKFGNKKYRKDSTRLEKAGYLPDDPNDKNSPNLLRKKADILFNQQKFKEAIKAYINTLRENTTKRVLTDADQADITMKIAYGYINIQDFTNAKIYLLNARKMYSKAKMAEEIRVIDSTLTKIESLMAI